MQNVPKIVVKGLRSPSPEIHPDADLLAAFAEQSLAAGERDRMLEHLARCGDCREVVALALPASEAVEPARSSSTRVGWLSLPVLRWGVVAAGLVAVASVGIQQYRQREREKMVPTSLMARNQLASSVQNPPRSSQESASQAVAPAEAGRQTETRKNAAAGAQSAITADRFLSRAPSAGGIPGGSGTAIGSGSGRTLDLAPRADRAYMSRALENPAPASAAKQNSVPGPAPQAATANVEVSGAAPPVTTETSAQNQIQDQAIQNEPAEQAQSSADRVGKAKPALVQASPASMTAAPTLGGDSSLMKSPAALRWTISSNGELQRSVDGGKTWRDVNIAVDNSMSSNLARRSTELVTQAQVESKADAKKTETKMRAKSIAPSAPTIFRALSVSADGAEIWAGGSGGALYHTMDGGDLWVRALPSAAGIVLTGDIVSIQFSDTNSGTVTTSNAEVWATDDDGHTWHKQQ